MRKVVLRISPLAKLALLAAMVGVGLAIWARESGPEWARPVGGLMLFGGAALYLIERYRGGRRPRD